MVWSVNEQSRAMSPKQTLSKEAACAGIHYCVPGLGEPPRPWLHEAPACCWVYIHRRRFQRSSSGHTTNEIVTSQLTLYNVFFHSINRLLLVLLPQRWLLLSEGCLLFDKTDLPLELGCSQRTCTLSVICIENNEVILY